MDRVDEFLFRGFIPEEKRGGVAHVVLNLGGKLVGPMSMTKAEDDHGWTVPMVEADIIRQISEERDTALAEVEKISGEREEARTLLEAATKANRDLAATLEAQDAHIAAMSSAVAPKTTKSRKAK